MAERVVVTDQNYGDLSIERDILEEAGYDVVDLQATDVEEIRTQAQDAVALLNQHLNLPSDLLTDLTDLRVIGRYGVGVDTIDLAAATTQDIVVLNVPDYCVDEVAEHTVALLLALYRNIPQYDRHVANGQWDWKIGKPLYRFSGSTVGLIGFGTIPRRICDILSGFNCDIITFDPYVEDSDLDRYDVTRLSFDVLIQQSDVVSVNAPLTDETRGMFDEDVFERMDGDSVLVNTARGGIVESDALIHALETNQIAGAALDVLPEEPPPTDSVLRELENVVVTPRVAWYSEDSVLELRRTLAKDVLRVLEGGTGNNVVNDVEPGSGRR